MNDKASGTGAQAHDDALDAAAFRRLLAHLDNRKDVQNIDLMNLSGFCRNCLSKWYAAAAGELGVPMDYEQARERVYGMPYAEWKTKFQVPLASTSPSPTPNSDSDS